MVMSHEQIVTAATEHWKKHRPREWAKMTPAERTEFVEDLATQVETETTVQAEGYREPPATTNPGRRERRENARLARAQESAMRELVFLPSETDATVSRDEAAVADEREAMAMFRPPASVMEPESSATQE